MVLEVVMDYATCFFFMILWEYGQLVTLHRYHCPVMINDGTKETLRAPMTHERKLRVFHALFVPGLVVQAWILIGRVWNLVG